MINKAQLTPLPKEEKLSKDDSYTCTLCSSQIEILSMKNNDITFKCLNNDIKNNHGLKTMSINQYIKEMEKNTYFFSICSICGQKQNSHIDNKVFKYCINKLYVVIA